MDKVKDASRLTGVRAALAKIVQLHHDFPAVLRELGDIESTRSNEKKSPDNQDDVENAKKKLCKDKELDNEFISKDYCGMTESLVIEQLSQEAASLNVDVSVAANSLVKAQVKNIIATSKDDINYNRDIKGLCRLVSILSQQGMIQGSSLGEQLLQEPAFIRLELKVLWWFHKAKITSFELILRSIYDSGRTPLSVSSELFSMITYDHQRCQIESSRTTLDNNCDDENSIWLQDVIGAVVALAYDLEDREEYVGLRKYAGNILTSITSKVMDFIHEDEKNTTSKKKSEQKSSILSGKRTHGNDSGECEAIYPLILNWYGLILKNRSISNSALEKYLSSQLVQILTHRPELGLGRVLREQERWRSTQASDTLSGLLRKLVVGLGHTSALDTLELVVTNDEVNWGAVLTLVATALNCHQDTANKLKNIIEQYIQRGCTDQDKESLIIGFLFARHACQEGRHIFPTYAQWFLSLFAGENVSPANTKPTFVFFVRFLTDLVPHDPAYCLRAHLSNQIFIPRGCQDIIRDYSHLARSRLRDLSETFEPNSRFNQNSEKNKVVEEVENAVSSFGKTGKVPKKVIEASIFRKPYFHSSFLPVLLTPRPLPDIPDDKLKLIENLYTSNKLPAAMYKNYFLLCRKEASDLFSGVFTDVQEEIVVDEPINELEAIINELVKHGEKICEMNEVLPILSRVSSKLEELLKFMDTRMKDSTFITIDIRLYNEKGIPYLICEKFFHLLETICFQKCEPGSIAELNLQLCRYDNRPLWLGQFLGLLATSMTLQSALFTLLMHRLKQGQEEYCLTVEKISLYAMIICELHSIDGLFLPVVSFAATEISPESFLKFFIKHLDCNSHQAIDFNTILTGSWISWYIFINKENEFDSEDKEAENIDSLLTNIINLYACLAPRFAVMEESKGKTEIAADYKSLESLEEKTSFIIKTMDVSDSEMSLADVYSRLSGLNVPPASQLYYTDQFKKLAQDYQVSLNDWIRFELKATWAKTQLSVRQTYLQCRIKQDFIETKSKNQIANKKSRKTIIKSTHVNSVSIMSDILSVLIDGGMNEIGASEVVMLLQSLLLESEDCGVYILEEWVKILNSNQKSMAQANNNQRTCRSQDVLLLSFMSLCRCLPSSLFLNPDKLLESGGALQTLIENLRCANTSCFMNLTDTSYFCSVLLALAGNKKTKSPQLQHYLMTFKQDICFHWDSLQKMFAWEAPKVSKQKCIEDFVSSLSSNNYMSLDASCASVRHISLILSGSDRFISDGCSGPVMLSNMLLYIAQQQIRGRIPMFPTDQMQISAEDEQLLLLCSKELMKQIKATTFNITIFLREILPTKNEDKMLHKVVPCATTYIVLFTLKLNSMKDANTSKAHPRMLEMLLICHELVSFWFENGYDVCLSRDSEAAQSDAQVTTNSKLSRSSHSPSKLSRKSSNIANIQSLSYIVQLTQQIYLFISKLSVKSLSDLDKNILENTDSEIKACIQKIANVR